jgi:hypothetical protein
MRTEIICLFLCGAQLQPKPATRIFPDFYMQKLIAAANPWQELDKSSTYLPYAYQQATVFAENATN